LRLACRHKNTSLEARPYTPRFYLTALEKNVRPGLEATKTLRVHVKTVSNDDLDPGMRHVD
jgi:hypothetical protein